jgi:hypothetical protein
MPYDKAQLFSERGQYCDCGCKLFAHDAHHAFIPQLKRFKAYADDPRNIILLNHDQHISRMFDNNEWRRKFWRLNVLRFGAEAMEDFRRSAPAKMDKDRFAFLNIEENNGTT